MKTSLMIGIRLDDFWNMTPWQFSLAISAYAERRENDHLESRWLVWHQAVLSKAKRIPDLKQFMKYIKKSVKGIDEPAIIARLKAHNRKVQASAGSEA